MTAIAGALTFVALVVFTTWAAAELPRPLTPAEQADKERRIRRAAEALARIRIKRPA